MRKFRHLIIKLTALLLVMVSLPSLAITCNWGDSGYPGINAAFDFGTVVVQRDTPVGTVLKTLSVTYPGGTLMGCTTNYTWVGKQILFQEKTSVANVFQTNISGVGIKVYRASRIFDFTDGINGNTFYSASQPVTAELIKVSSGGVSSGGLKTGVFTTITIAEATQLSVSTSISGGNILSVACSITNPILNFPIGNILATSFGTSVGTIPSNTQNTQSLGLNCDAGANINITLQGTQNPDVGTTSVLALTGQGNADVAKGVGVQLVYNGTPLALNNRIVLKKSAGGQETFPITAQYYQTKNSVATGKANASATLDLTYQ